VDARACVWLRGASHRLVGVGRIPELSLTARIELSEKEKMKISCRRCCEHDLFSLGLIEAVHFGCVAMWGY
jgi:hypothetical protein